MGVAEFKLLSPSNQSLTLDLYPDRLTREELAMIIRELQAEVAEHESEVELMQSEHDAEMVELEAALTLVRSKADQYFTQLNKLTEEYQREIGET